MPKPYNHIRLFYSAVNRVTIKSLIHNRTIKKCLFNHFHNILRLFDTLSNSFHHKWYETWLSVMNMAYTSCIAIFQSTYDLRSYETRKYQENLKNSWNHCPAPSRPCQHQQKNPENQKLNPSHNALSHTKTKVSLEYPLNDCSPTKMILSPIPSF